MFAAQRPKLTTLKMSQLLATFGADLSTVNNDGVDALDVAADAGADTVADFLEAVATWPAFKIAAACRLYPGQVRPGARRHRPRGVSPVHRRRTKARQ